MKAHRTVLSIFAMALAMALAFFLVPAITDSGKQASAHWPYTLIYYDGHMHTTRSDGTGEVSDIKATALARGLDAVIVTDHCKDLTLDEWNSLVAETAAVSDDSFLALAGVEITGSEGIFNRDHFNAWNIADPFVGDDALEQCPEEVWESPLNPYGTGAMYPENIAQWADYVHSQGGIINHNHTTGHTLPEYGVNNVEIYNQGHVDDIASYARALGIDPVEAWGFAITINNFAIYGERDLNTVVDFLGNLMPLRLALYLATTYIPPYIGQVMGWSDPPDPTLPGDLTSWDELLMAYVDGTLDKPTFGVANSDAHNTNFMDADSDGNEGEDDIDGIDNDGDTLVDEDPPTWHPLDSKVGTAKNGLYVRGLTPRQIYKAIEAGRSFATTGPSLYFDVNGRLMGGTAYVWSGGSANLNLSVDSESSSAILVNIDIIKNGEVVQTINPMSSTYDGTLVYDVNERGYYRVEVTSCEPVGEECGAYQFAWSNPVFVKCPLDDDCDGYLNLIERILGSDPDDAGSTPEHWLIWGTCKDKLDNDGDGLIDKKDPGCR